MKKLLILIAFMLSVAASDAQIAKWLIKPEYDKMELLENNLFKAASRQKTIFWNIDGEKIVEVDNMTISPFREGLAVMFVKGTNKVAGILQEDGKVIDLQKWGYTIDNDYPYFSCGFLLIKSGNQYYYLNKNGNVVYGPFAKCYPFFENVACVRNYKNVAKNLEDQYWTFVSTTNNEKYVDENVKVEDITFCSSVHNGKALVALGKNFYFFDYSTLSLDQLYTDSIVKDKKTRVVAERKEMQMAVSDTMITVFAKNAIFKFDKFLRMISHQYKGGQEQLSPIEQPLPPIIKSQFDSVAENGAYGLEFNGRMLLPPQFENVLFMKDNKAIVVKDDKCGVIVADKNSSLKFRLNNNEQIGFTHQYYITELAASFPSYIKSSTAKIVSRSKDCVIQTETRSSNENFEGNTLKYNCRLSIPKTLTDTLSTHDYFYALEYDGLTSIDHKVTLPEWYIKYYEVSLSKADFSIAANDTIMVEFDLIKTDEAKADEKNYFKNVELVATNLPEIPTLNKITENHYSFRLAGIEQERVAFSVKITETGCPSIEYPFEMVFVKPEPKAKNKNTTVTIKAVQNRKAKKLYIPGAQVQ